MKSGLGIYDVEEISRDNSGHKIHRFSISSLLGEVVGIADYGSADSKQRVDAKLTVKW